ncbi:hypothetical protein [Polluticoccus soli]|uniref:hypothetical protein n=1 Tax=Polluticoccus soli TaxID=3034150 RepID=UPI0023E3115C|nr:hypothetical protein [Flavipsychrobacter sp. JY13-12]
MKRMIFIFLMTAPFMTWAQDSTDKVFIAEQKDFALHPEKAKYQGRVDTIFYIDAATGEKQVAELKLKRADWEYQEAVAAYKRGEYAKAHQYAYQTLKKAKLSKQQQLDLYDLAIKSSYSNSEFSSAIVYYQDMMRKKLKIDDELTKLAIFSYFPAKALHAQNYYNINPKDTTFILGLVNKMVAKDPKWLMVRSKIYSAVRDVDELPADVRQYYKMKTAADAEKYAAEFEPTAWEDILP